MKTIIILSTLLLTAFAAYGNVGACKTQNYKDVDLDVNRYVGQWFNVYVTKSFFFSSVTDKCISAVYAPNGDGRIKVHNSRVTEEGEVKSADALATVVKPGHLKVKFSTFQFVGGNYEVVYINDNYTVAAVVGCNGVWKLGFSDVWILVKQYDRDLSAEIQKAIDSVKQQGFDISDLVPLKTEQCDKLRIWL